MALPRAVRVKNKNPVQIQVTAEQILREARERQVSALIKTPKQSITDSIELSDYLYENARNSKILFDDRIWLMAAQFEIRQLNLTGARSILGQAIGKAPKDKIFKKYIEIELQLGNIDRCRKLEKYLEWSPENCYAWSMYAELEKSLSKKDRARSIFELEIAQSALDMPELIWKAYIDFGISEGEFESTRRLYERLLERTKHLKVWISFAKFEASAKSEEQESLRIQCLQNARRVSRAPLTTSENLLLTLKRKSHVVERMVKPGEQFWRTWG